MNVADWLRTLGFERYEATFRDNDVSAELVISLTAEDLKDLGISSVGHRRQLLEAIAALRSNAVLAHDPVDVSTGPTDHPRSTRSTAERRQLSVMFCDIVGFTSLSARLDPEDLGEVIRGYQSRVAATIAGFGGYIARYVGDGVLIYFGWPKAREADAERAVRAALAVVSAVRQASLRGEPLRVRIGIATGLVVVGEPIGMGDARQQTAIGETPNLAARLQGLAGPNEVVIDAATRRLIGGLFECQDLGTVELKGLPEAVPVWQALGERMLESRFEAFHGSAMTPLIGREGELQLLLTRWRQAAAGEGQLVLLSGEPGIGKSRLIAALEERLSAEPHAKLRYFCSPHHQENALYPVITRWEHEAGFAHSDLSAEKLSKLEAVLLPVATSGEDVALIADLLAVPFGDRYPPLAFSPQRKKEKTLEALSRRLISRAHEQPLLMLLEDAHWADPSSLELLDAVIGLLSDLPILLVASFRPEFIAPWVGNAGVSLIALNRLNHRQAEQLAAQVTIEHVLPPALLERIIAQADGVPLFIEELTKAVLESTQLEGSAPAAAVPATLQASLMARLDRLPVAKQVAQIGAVIGREFSHALLAAVTRLPGGHITQGLDELVTAGLAFRRGASPDAVYAFKHALVQDVAYDSLLRSRRAEIHAAIVNFLERDTEGAIRQAALLGYHSSQAGLIGKAATYYRLAGERSAERSAFAETRILLDRGLSLAATLPDSPDRRRLEAELLVALGRFLHMTKGMTDDEALIAFERAIDLSRTLNETELLTRGLYNRCVNLQTRGNHDAVWHAAQELLSIGEKRDDARARIVAYVMLGATLLLRGCFAEGRADLETAQKLCVDVDVNFDIFGSAVVISGPINSALCLACLGYLDQAAAEISLLADRAHRHAPFARARALAILCQFARITRDMVAFEGHADSLASLSNEQGFAQYIGVARFNRAWLTGCAGHAEANIHDMQAMLARVSRPVVPAHLMLADVLSIAGQSNDALQSLDKGLATSAATGETWLNSELRRRKGELLHADTEAAESELRAAIDIARTQSAKLFELRAAMSLARLLSAQKRHAEAQDLLAPIYAWFTEGFDRPDLQEASTLLVELAA